MTQITVIVWWCGHLPRGRYPGVWSQVGLRKHYYKVTSSDGIPVKLFQKLVQVMEFQLSYFKS